MLEVNILPEKHCNFDCIFCPIGRSQNKVDSQKSFDKIDSSLIELESMIENTKNDDEKSIQEIKSIIKEISPSKIIVARMEDERFKKKLGITDERFEEISKELLNS